MTVQEVIRTAIEEWANGVDMIEVNQALSLAEYIKQALINAGYI